MTDQHIVVVGDKIEKRVVEIENILVNYIQSPIKLAENYDELEDLCKTWNPTLLIYVMPAAKFAQLGKDYHIPQLPTILVTSAFDSLNEDLKQLFHEVDDFIFAPFNPVEFIARLTRFFSASPDAATNIQNNILLKMRKRELVGNHPVFADMLAKLYDFAKYDAAVMLAGETGVGKELCARAIHYFSPRANYPFIPVECSSMPAHLIENELFGHEQGAYTDARLNKAGIVAAAEGGTLFFDEIDSLSIEAQSKLLRLLEEKRYRPVGSNKYVQANIRIIAATNVNLEERIREKSFRSDLYYRLNIVLHIPPLRERLSDIPLLSRHLMQKIAAEFGTEEKRLTHAALQKLLNHNWPGNVRELRNVLQNAMLLSRSTFIAPQDINLPVGEKFDFDNLNFNKCKKDAIERFEKEFIIDLLRKNDGNITKAAQTAGKDRRDLGRLMKKYRIDKNKFQPETANV